MLTLEEETALVSEFNIAHQKTADLENKMFDHFMDLSKNMNLDELLKLLKRCSPNSVTYVFILDKIRTKKLREQNEQTS